MHFRRWTLRSAFSLHRKRVCRSGTPGFSRRYVDKIKSEDHAGNIFHATRITGIGKTPEIYSFTRYNQVNETRWRASICLAWNKMLQYEEADLSLSNYEILTFLESW
jgi:hypothetical protein